VVAKQRRILALKLLKRFNSSHIHGVPECNPGSNPRAKTEEGATWWLYGPPAPKWGSKIKPKKQYPNSRVRTFNNGFTEIARALAMEPGHDVR